MIQYLKTTLLGLLMVLTFVQCTVESHTHITDKEQGWSKVSMDMAGMSDMMGMMGAGEEGNPLDSIMMMRDSMHILAASMNEAAVGTGVSNIEIDVTEEEMFMKYDFEDFGAIGRFAEKMAEREDAQGTMNMFGAGGGDKLRRKGKRYYIDLASQDLAENMPAMDDLQGMESFFSFSYVYSFDRTIRSVKAPFEVEQTDHEVRFELSMKDLMDLGKSGDSEVEIRVR